MEGLSAFLTNVGDVVSQFWTWVGTVASTIVGNPLYFIPVGIFVAGAAVGLFQRLYTAARG